MSPDAVETVFDCGYAPSAHKGRITKCSGARVVEEINQQPAAEVYDQWTGGAISEALMSGSGGKIAGEAALNPLARRVDIDRYELLLPDSITDTSGLAMFANVEVGETLVLMAGTKDSLIDNIGRVRKSLVANAPFSEENISAGLLVYGSGIALGDQKSQVATKFSACLGGKPFIGIQSFGEQVCWTTIVGDILTVGWTRWSDEVLVRADQSYK